MPILVNYYRLKQTDLDGGCRYSQIIRISRNPEKNKPVLQPNPAGDVAEVAAKGKKYELIDLLGITQRKGVFGSDGRILLDGLRPGAYVLLVYMETGVEKLRLIRE